MQCNKKAPYSITSSAATSIDCGTVILSVSAFTASTSRIGSSVPLGDIASEAGRGIWISRERYHVTRSPILPFRAMCDSPLTELR
jgi:hypothetical protein